MQIIFDKKKRKKKANPAEKVEFSKILTAVIVAFFLINFEIIVGVSFWLMYQVGDVTPLNEMLIGTFGVISVVISAVVGFYQWKTKAINIIKIKKALGLRITDDDIKENGNFEGIDDKNAEG